MSPWSFWILSAIFVVRWSVLWWRTRRARLRFALLAPVGAVAGVAIGLISVLSSRPQASCFGGECRRDAAHSAFDFDANSGLDGLILINSWLAFFVATVLALLTLVTETVLMVRRHERARGVDSST